MSVAYSETPTRARPVLRIVHSQPPEPPAAADVLPAGQQELPLVWPADRDGEAAARALARYPAIPLQPGIPRPGPYVAQAAALVADVLVGARAPGQLRGVALLDVQHMLARRAARLTGRPFAGPARILSTSCMTVSSTCIIVTAVFRVGSRGHGAALRMEYRHGRWLVTEVQSPA